MAKQYTQAMMHIETACELKPNDPWTHISAALLLAFSGERERSTELARNSLDLSLAPSRTITGRIRPIFSFSRGHYQAALDTSDRAHDVLWALPGLESGRVRLPR